MKINKKQKKGFFLKIKDMDFFKDVKKGFGIMLGMSLFLGILFGVYAFVQPTSGPNNNYVLDWASPLNKMHNDTNQKVTNIQSTVGSISTNDGQYDNRIADRTFPYAYTEICFKGGAVYHDEHSGGESTVGGNCSPGDVGFVIEQNEEERINSTGAKGPDYWEQAKAACLKDKMRLPEPFEFKYACVNAGTFGLNSMTGDWEWASNFALPVYDSNYGVGAVIMGYSGCGCAYWGWVGSHDGGQHSLAFRCAS